MLREPFPGINFKNFEVDTASPVRAFALFAPAFSTFLLKLDPGLSN